MSTRRATLQSARAGGQNRLRTSRQRDSLAGGAVAFGAGADEAPVSHVADDVFELLGSRAAEADFEEIGRLIDAHPEIANINSAVKQKA